MREILTISALMAAGVAAIAFMPASDQIQWQLQSNAQKALMRRLCIETGTPLAGPPMHTISNYESVPTGQLSLR